MYEIIYLLYLYLVDIYNISAIDVFAGPQTVFNFG